MEENLKHLLLKDLCARLPYGVVVRHADYLVDSDGNHTGQFWYKQGYLYDICRIDDMTTTIIESEDSDEEGYEHICDLERSLPYLRPMSSMTEEEKEKYHSLCNCNDCDFNGEVLYFDTIESFDYLNSIHIDYRGLLRKGLAIAVTKENNPYKK